MSLILTSPDFTQGNPIPRAHTCEGADRAPALQWTADVAGVRSFALIVDDPDAPDPAAPKRTYVHWVLYNIPASARELRAEAPLPDGALDGTNDWGKTGYGGPCPPIGRHRYFFKLYALDTTLHGLHTPTKRDIEAAMQGHILAQTELMGTYEKVDRQG